MSRYSELWQVNEVSVTVVVGSVVSEEMLTGVSFDHEAASEAFGELAALYLKSYLEEENTGVNLKTRTGMPPSVVYESSGRASTAAECFEQLTHIPLSQVVATRP